MRCVSFFCHSGLRRSTACSMYVSELEHRDTSRRASASRQVMRGSGTAAQRPNVSA
jgi:hypothetical protein